MRLRIMLTAPRRPTGFGTRVCDPQHPDSSNALRVTDPRSEADIQSLGQFPGVPILTREQLAGFLVADDDFFFRVPFDLALDEHGNKTQVAGNERTMRRFDGGDRWLAGLHAIQKVAVMVVRLINLHLLKLFRN